MIPFRVSGYTFEGPFEDAEDVPSVSGVYVVMDRQVGDSYKLLDCGLSDDMRKRLRNHDRSDCWKEHANGQIVFGIHRYRSKSFCRWLTERVIRATHSLPCGDK